MGLRGPRTGASANGSVGGVPAMLVAGVVLLALAACGNGGRDTELVVHSSLPRDVGAYAESVFESDFPTVDVRIVAAEPDETVAALRDGVDAVDVWWGAPGTLLEDAADEGLLTEYRPPWLRQPGVGQADPQARWQPTLVSPFVIAFNRERVSLSDAPTDWIDLFHQSWYLEIDLVDPSRDDTMAQFDAAMIVEALRDDDDLNRGFDWLRRLEDNVGEYVPDAQQAIRNLRTGDALLTILPRHVVEEARHGDSPWLHYRLPESGTPMLSRGVAIPARAAHPDLARTFVDLVGRVDVATTARLHTRWMPAYGDVEEARLPADFEMDMPWRPWPLAADTIARERDGWIDRWELEVRGR